MITKFNELNEAKELEGKRVRLISMDNDPHPIEAGEEGTIQFVDGIGQLHINWDNGRRLALIPNVDKYIILNEELDAVTVGMVGSGTAVTGYPTGSFTSSAGQAVYGGDSGSAFASNSNASNSVDQEVICPPKHIFKVVKEKKNRKDKQQRIYNQIGSTIDHLDKPTKKTNNEHIITNWNEFPKLNEDDGGGGDGGSTGSGDAGSGYATLGSIGGMGAIISAQPSSIPGDVAGSTKGSGDIARSHLGPYAKVPGGNLKKRKKDKRDKPYHKIGAGIDNFYVSKYVQDTKGGRIIQNWKTFSDTK